MARPIKVGLTYFPLDVDIDQDDKVSVIEALHGIEGFSIIIKLLMKIYKEGYFYKWGEREQLIFSRRINVDINTVKAVVNDCINEGLFNKSVFDLHSVLTSKGIQKRYLEAVKRRKQVEFFKDYYLIDDVKTVLGNSKIEVFIVNAEETGVNVNINPQADNVNDNISTQRKEKDSKEKDSKVNYPPADNVTPAKFNAVEELIANNIITGAGITKTLNDDLNDIYDSFGFAETDAVINEAIKVAVRGNGKTWRFIFNKLDYWRKAGVKTLFDAKNLESKGNNSGKGVVSGGKDNADLDEHAAKWLKVLEERAAKHERDGTSPF